MPSRALCTISLRAAQLVLGCATVLTWASCSNGDDVDMASYVALTATPLSAVVAAPDGEPMFRRLEPSQCGLEFKNSLVRAHVLPYMYNGAGTCIGDYDGDGLPDVYLVSQDGPNKLFRQTTPLRFEDVTAAAGVDGGDAWGAGATFVDYDDDGDLDLFVCNTHSPNLLYRNRGDGTFVECAADVGLAHVGASTMPSFADYDNDGDLDLYLLTNRMLSPAMPPGLVKDIRMPEDAAQSAAEIGADKLLVDVMGRSLPGGQPDILFRNDGGRFADVTAAAGIADRGMGLSATWWDFDDDGWLDLYVANDLESPDVLYHNECDGTFRNVTAERLPHLAYFGMGSDFGDIDNDGRFDLIVADMSSTDHYKGKLLMGGMDNRGWFLADARPQQYMRNQLFLNTGTDRFLEIGFLAGVASSDWTWAVKFGDLDNDGWVDLFATNGIPRFDNHPDLNPQLRQLLRANQLDRAIEFVKSIPPVLENNLAFRNGGDLHFEDVSEAWGLDFRGVSHGAAYADLDRDGDLDLVVNNMNMPVCVYENTSAAGNRLLIRLVGTRSNRFGLGARVTLEAGGVGQTRLCSLAHGYLSADEPLLHFGLGDAARIDLLTVRWPNGVEQRFTELAAGKLYTITEPPNGEPVPARAPVVTKLFEDVAAARGLEFRHRERAFDDFAAQGLLPHRHSRLGPGVAVGDVDGDGRDDVFVGGAAGQAGELFRAQGDGTFATASGPWAADAACEDLGAAWLDADSDGDLDLYVVSGSVESDDKELLRDRLYHNDGTGGFERAGREALPDLTDSGAAVCAADYDRDGDLDLFVAGRIRPGAYPLAPPSRIYRNDGGRFVDATADVAPALRNAGLVTAGTWTDLDDDGAVDLVIAAHWKPIRTLYNDGAGKLVDRTADSGLAAFPGLWNGVASGDLDGDGDIDLVATNLGWNSKYTASREHPMRIYAKDFDDNGVLDIIEAKYEGDRLLPVRGRSCSSKAIPFLADKFKTYDAFARASLEEIYTLPALREAGTYKATFLANAILVNQGDGKFEVRALPRLAQGSAGFGIAVVDFDGDGRKDLYLAQNFFSPEPETGRIDGGLSLLLHNRGDLRFEPLPVRETGLSIPGDAKGLATVDLDGDARPDFCVTTNDGALRVFANRAPADRARCAIRLEGPPGNPTAVGARVTLTTRDGRRQVAEVHAGSGYLSQSSPTLFFAVDAPAEGGEVTVRWPGGTTSAHPLTTSGLVRIRRP